MDRESLNAGLLSLYRIFPIVLALIMGFVLIAQGTFEIISFLETDRAHPFNLISFVIMIVGGALVLIYGIKNQVRCIGIYALALGLSRLLFRLSSINVEEPVSMFINMAFIIMAANLCYTGVSFIRGYVIRRSSMLITSSLLALMSLLLFSMGPTIEGQTGLKILTYSPEVYMVNFVMYLTLLLLLDSVQIRFGSPEEMHAGSVERIRASYRFEKGSAITRAEARCLLDRKGELWKDIGDGFIKSEMSFRISGIAFGTTAIAQIWEGSDDLYLTIYPSEGSVVAANRLKIEHLFESEGKLYFYGHTGADFSLIIKEEAPA